MSADLQPDAGDPEIAELNRIIQNVLAKEHPTEDELELLHRLQTDVVDLFPHSRRVEGR